MRCSQPDAPYRRGAHGTRDHRSRPVTRRRRGVCRAAEGSVQSTLSRGRAEPAAAAFRQSSTCKSRSRVSESGLRVHLRETCTGFEVIGGQGVRATRKP